MVSLQKIGGERIRLSSTLGFRSPGFEINDLGFLRRADEIPQASWLQWRFDRPGRYVRNVRINFNQWSAHNFDGDRIISGGNVNAHWTFQNFWSTGFGINLNGREFDDRLTRGGPGGYINPKIGSWQYFNTDDRKVLSFHLNTFFNNDGRGSRVLEANPRLAFRPTSAVSGELGFRWADNRSDAQWVERVDVGETPHYVFGRLDQTTGALTVRLNYTITPNLSLQLYGQPFVSAGAYRDYKELVDGRAERYAERYAPFAYEDDADFTVLSFRTTNVLRWEFKPGSTFFVVWQQGREGEGEGGTFQARDFADIFAHGGSNTVLVKLAYWINP
jgi:hypothetical protein